MATKSINCFKQGSQVKYATDRQTTLYEKCVAIGETILPTN